MVEIWRHVREPADLTSFALVSRKVFKAGHWSLKNHRARIKKYSTLSNALDRSVVGFNSEDIRIEDIHFDDSLPFFFTDLLSDPHIGLYVRNLHVDDIVGVDYGSAERSLHLAHIYRDSALIKGALAALIQPRKLEELMSMSQVEYEALLLCLIFILCPNMKSLRLSGIDSLMHGFQGSVRMVRDFTFRKLERVKLHSWRRNMNDRGMDFVKLLSTLPSLRSIDVNLVDAGEYCNISTPKSSNVGALKFMNSQIDSQCLGNLLEVFKCLKTFSYAVNCDLWFALADVISVLLQHTRTSLKTLALHNSSRVISEEKHANIGSLCGFKALKNLYLDLDLLLRHKKSEPLTIAMDLPLSIEKVTIRCDEVIDLKMLSVIISDMVEAKIKLLVELVSLEIYLLAPRGDSLTWGLDAFRVECQMAGFTLCIKEETPNRLNLEYFESESSEW